VIACITDAELSFGSFSVPVLRREAVPSFRRMAEELFAETNGVHADAAERQAQRQKALEELQKLWSKQKQPLGGKWWKTREELYDA
jgi:hypothetical protein